jgi:hypothetical protein
VGRDHPVAPVVLPARGNLAALQGLVGRGHLVVLAVQGNLAGLQDLVDPVLLVGPVVPGVLAGLVDREVLSGLAARVGPSVRRVLVFLAAREDPVVQGGPTGPCGPGSPWGPGGPGGKLPMSTLPSWPVAGSTNTAWFGASGLIAMKPARNIPV